MIGATLLVSAYVTCRKRLFPLNFFAVRKIGDPAGMFAKPTLVQPAADGLSLPFLTAFSQKTNASNFANRDLRRRAQEYQLSGAGRYDLKRRLGSDVVFRGRRPTSVRGECRPGSIVNVWASRIQSGGFHFPPTFNNGMNRGLPTEQSPQPLPGVGLKVQCLDIWSCNPSRRLHGMKPAKPR